MHYQRTVWEVDPRYWRVEVLDDEGQHLGNIWFELRNDLAETHQEFAAEVALAS